MDQAQLTESCPDCRVEGAMLALFDPTVAMGVATEARCRLCGRAEELGRLLMPGRRFATRGEVRRELERWAAEEGEPDVDRFCRAHMSELDAEGVAQRVLRGEAVATSFDVLGLLFPGMSGGGGAAPDPREARVGEGRPLEPAPEAPLEFKDPLRDQLRLARSLAAVMLADGQLRTPERRFIEARLAREGLPPLGEADLRAWRPVELGAPEDPRPIVEAMVELCHIDEERDGSEWRVVREYARAWGYPLSELESRGARAEARIQPLLLRLWKGVTGLLFVSDER